MQTTGTGNSYTEFSDLARLRTASVDNPQKALESVARQFEALFTQMIFKSMRNAELSGGLFDNNQTKMYQDILDKQLSTSLSSKKGLGIADLLISQLSRANKPTLSADNSSNLNSGTTVNNTSSVGAGNNISNITKFSDSDAFVKTMYPIARKVESDYQIPARSLVAQSALETGWGKHVIHDSNGRSSFNLFGIKADDSWHGKVVMAKTTEFVGGNPITKYEPFRAYDSFEESMTDYARHISSEPRYAAAFEQRKEPVNYFTGLQLAGYATDPNYANKINRILSNIEIDDAVAS